MLCPFVVWTFQVNCVHPFSVLLFLAQAKICGREGPPSKKLGPFFEKRLVGPLSPCLRLMFWSALLQLFEPEMSLIPYVMKPVVRVWQPQRGPWALRSRC